MLSLSRSKSSKMSFFLLSLNWFSKLWEVWNCFTEIQSQKNDSFSHNIKNDQFFVITFCKGVVQCNVFVTFFPHNIFVTVSFLDLGRVRIDWRCTGLCVWWRLILNGLFVGRRWCRRHRQTLFRSSVGVSGLDSESWSSFIYIVVRVTICGNGTIRFGDEVAENASEDESKDRNSCQDALQTNKQ